MKVIYTRKGEEILVDAADYEWLNQYTWHITESKGHKSIRSRILGKVEKIHRLITGCPNGLVVDHINGDTLDNRRVNLRVCTQKENVRNKRKMSLGAHKYKGICRMSRGPNWRAQIRVNGKNIFSRSKSSQEAAALEYNKLALKHFGEFARLNTIDN